MFGHINTALRFFVIGLAIGVLIAPRPGQQTRAMIRRRIESIVNEVLGIAGMPPIETSGSQEGVERRRGRDRRGKEADAATSAQ